MQTDNSKKNWLRGYLTLSGERFDPDEIRKMIGFSGCETRRRNEVVFGNLFGHDEISYSTGIMNTVYPEDVEKRLLLRFGLSKRILKEAAKRANGTWGVLIEGDSHSGMIPSPYVSSEMISFLDAINAEIGFDIIVYR